MGLGWASDGHQNAYDVAQMVSNGSQNTSLVSERPQICFVDGFQLQKVAAAVRIVNPRWPTSFVGISCLSSCVVEN